MKTRTGIIVGTAGMAAVATAVMTAFGAGASSRPALTRPVDLRELVFLSSGHGMAYGPARNGSAGTPPFTNVYVTPAAYRDFMKTGQWPEGATFFLEVRQGVEHVSINSGGQSQGDLLALEAAVKDSKRNPDGGWAYFDFGPGGREPEARMLPRTESCYACHSRHGAVEWTFTQFYPEQFAVAKTKGTVRGDYDPDVRAK